MLEIRPDGTLKDQNELRIRYENKVKSILDASGRSDLETILQRHDDVFKGIGKIYDKKNGEEFLVKFSFYEIRGCTHCTETKACSLLS